MKILEYEIDLKSLKNNLENLADLNRRMLYEERPDLMQYLEYENDNIFLEPTLFFYPKDNKSYSFTTPIEQLIFGYSDNKEAFDEMLVISDSNGYINLPGYGYLRTIPNNKFYFKVSQDKKNVKLLNKNRENIDFIFEDFKYIPDTTIKFINHQPEILSNYLVTYFNEPVAETVDEYKQNISLAFQSIKKLAPDFANLLEKTNKEFCVFNSKMPPYSMAALFYFGTAFMNVNNEKHGRVFFIDDISHQAGHTLFYGLTYDFETYLIPPPSTALKDFTKLQGEARDVYGAFHGLFTYTAIINTLTKFIESSMYNDKLEYTEAIARLGFYMNKFGEDLKDLNNKEILTAIGFEHYEMFYTGYDLIKLNYEHLYCSLDYSNQDYIFNFQKFLMLNQI